MAVAVKVGVPVLVGVELAVGVRVGVAVDVAVRVGVRVAVLVAVAVMVEVAVAVPVAVGVLVMVGVAVAVAVLVAVEVAVAVGVFVGSDPVTVKVPSIRVVVTVLPSLNRHLYRMRSLVPGAAVDLTCRKILMSLPAPERSVTPYMANRTTPGVVALAMGVPQAAEMVPAAETDAYVRRELSYLSSTSAAIIPNPVVSLTVMAISTFCAPGSALTSGAVAVTF